jgi:polysaccharide export outer membrane protein
MQCDTQLMMMLGRHWAVYYTPFMVRRVTRDREEYIVHDAARYMRPAPIGLRRALVGVACAIALSACANQGDNLPPIPDTDAAIYHLGPGDKIRIITFGDQDLSGQFRLDSAGLITLPLIGPIHAAGMTETELQATIGAALIKMDLFKKPSVSVEILDYRPVFVLGEVTKPGQYPYQPGMTVLTAVAIAGGFTYRAVEDKFSIVRNQDGHKQEGLAKRDTTLQPGDVVDVYERSF